MSAHAATLRPADPRALSLLVASLAVFAFAAAANAATVVLDYDDLVESQLADFQTGPYIEDVTTMAVNAGHYELVADPDGEAGDRVFQIDEQQLGLSEVSFSVGGGLVFDAVSVDVVNPAESAAEYTITAVGGSGGTLPAPTAAGPLAFGPGFQGITGIVITQNAPGALAFDDLTIEVLPEPAYALALVAGLALLVALHRHRGQRRRRHVA